METQNWSGELKIGVEFIDKEHREMAQAIDELRRAVGALGQKSLVGPLLRKLADVTRKHFSDEESMMQATAYPGTAIHMLKHQHLLEQLDSLAARFNRGGFLLNEHSVKFLRDWLSVHIEKDDLQFALWVNENGKR